MHGSLTLLSVVMMLTPLSPLPAQHQTRHAVSLEYSGLMLYGSPEVGYEIIVSERTSFRFGFGAPYVTTILADIEGYGGSAMVNFMSRGIYKFEWSAGISVMRTNFGLTFSDERYDLGLHVFPAVSVGFRTLPRRSGWFWRAGAAWMYGFGLPLHVGIGYVF
ncbi:hypothetical protein KQI65_17015 [bacterium]|nr:hypothetical protein [bacterium]